MVSFPLEIRPCTPGSEKITPSLPTPHASRIGKDRHKFFQMGRLCSKVLRQSPKIIKSVMDTFRETKALVGDMSECLLELAKEAADPRDSGSHESELAEYLVPVVRFWSGVMLARISFRRSMLGAGSSSVWVTQSMSQPRMTWRVVHVAPHLNIC
jgi:hypothetical protein